MDATADPCACTQTGLSGGKNTSRIGCGQWDIVSGSNRFTCFVNVRRGHGSSSSVVLC